MIDKSAKPDEYSIAIEERQRHVDAIVHSEAIKKIVVAGPGTGKTYLFKSVLEGKSPCLTLTFVNSLVEDLSLELFGQSDVKTLHGFARSQLALFKQESVRVYPKLSEVIKQDAEILLGCTIDFDHLFHNRAELDERLEFYRDRRKYYDHYGFADIVYAAVLAYDKDEERIPAYEQVVVDEFQDFNDLEVALIEFLATKSPVLLAGDDDQALYETLKSASPSHIRERFVGVVEGYVRFTLPYCSRSTSVIVETTNDIIAKAQEKGLLAERISKDFQYFPCAEKDSVCEANPKIIHSNVFANQIPWFIQKQILAITNELRRKYTVLILSPTRIQCRAIYNSLNAKGFQNVNFSEKADMAEPTLLDGLKLLLLDAKCNLGWRITAKALISEDEFNTLLQKIQEDPDVLKFADILSSTLKTQVRPLLTSLRKVRDRKTLSDNNASELFSQIDIDMYDVATEFLRDQLEGTAQLLVKPAIRSIPIEVTTFQSSKGLAADYVFITHFDDRYCVRDNDAGMSDQDVCSFLVALTRARQGVYLLSTDNSVTPTFLSWIDKKRIHEIQSPGAMSE